MRHSLFVPPSPPRLQIAVLEGARGALYEIQLCAAFLGWAPRFILSIVYANSYQVGIHLHDFSGGVPFQGGLYLIFHQAHSAHLLRYDVFLQDLTSLRAIAVSRSL